MLTAKSFLALLCLSIAAIALPIRREVPQEHSHEQFLTVVRTNLNLNNPDNIGDPVFPLLGNAAATQGLGNIADVECLQQATADQAFTNAKAANDVDGMVGALIYRALERNTGAVGQASNLCTSITAVNPEIAAIQQHQDPASDGAAATNKATVLELAKQIAAVGGDPLDALKSGTFAPGQIGDPTAAGNTCDDANDAQGCIFTQNLLVEDATADEITAALAGAGGDAGDAGAGSNNNAGDDAAAGDSASQDCETQTVTTTSTVTVDPAASTGGATETCAAVTTQTVTVTVDPGASTTAAAGATSTPVAASATTTDTPAATETSSLGAGANQQKFTGNLGGAAPAVTPGGRGFQVEGSDDFLNVGAALGRSCDIQHNACANAANSGADFSVEDCDTQNNDCRAAI